MRDDQKLSQSRGTLAAFVDLLSPEDRFDVIAFNNGANSVFGELAPANEDNRRSAAEFLQSRRRGAGRISPLPWQRHIDMQSRGGR